MLQRIRRRLTASYVGVLALILLLFGVIVLASFSRQVSKQQDKLLMQKAEAGANAYLNVYLTGGKFAGVKATTKSDIAVMAVKPDGAADEKAKRLTGSESTLGLPYVDMARQAAGEKEIVYETVGGPEGPTRVVSRPLYESSGTMVAVIQAAQSRGVLRETVGRLVYVLAAVGVGALLLCALGGLFMSRRAMRPVQESFRRQRAFVADASHELKTPLSLVKINAEVMRRSLGDPGAHELIDDQLSEIDRMDALLSDLLILARLDAGRLELSDTSFDLAKAAAGAAGRFDPRASAEGVRIEGDVPVELPVRGDPERTGQILAALLDNAVRHTSEGGLITLSGHLRDGQAEVSVADTGPGIPPEHLPRIFDRFYRVEESRTREGGGTGLGLSIARDLARAQGGELTAGDSANTGATFTLKLPLTS